MTAENEDSKPFFLPIQISEHHHENDLWVTVFNRVLDLSRLVAKYRSTHYELLKPLILRAGEDVSHWFDKNTHQPKTFIDPNLACKRYVCPDGRFLGVPSHLPESTRNAVNEVWW